MSEWIKRGMCVVSITNLDIPMTVEEFKYKTGNIIDDTGQVVPKKFLIGIQCYRCDENKVRIHEVLHSKELVPYSVAQKGTMEAIKFHDRVGEYKDY